MLRKGNKSVIFKALLNLQCPGLVLRNCVKYSRMFYVFVSRIVKLTEQMQPQDGTFQSCKVYLD